MGGISHTGERAWAACLPSSECRRQRGHPLDRFRFLELPPFSAPFFLPAMKWWTKLSSKESVCQCRRQRHRFDPWVRKALWRKKWQPAPVFLPGEFHGQRSLLGYSPWGRRELDMNGTGIQQYHHLCIALILKKFHRCTVISPTNHLLMDSRFFLISMSIPEFRYLNPFFIIQLRGTLPPQ